MVVWNIIKTYDNFSYTSSNANIIIGISQFVGQFPSSVNYCKMLERSKIYKNAQYWNLFHPNRSMGATPLYIFEEEKYLHVFGSWHLAKKKHVILRFAHNMKHKCEGFIMKIFFDILQNMFQELMWKFELDITLLLDVFTCLLYNQLCN